MRLPPEAGTEGSGMIIERMVNNEITEIRKRYMVMPYKRKEMQVNAIPVARLLWDGKRSDSAVLISFSYPGSIGNAAVMMRATSTGPGRKQALAAMEKAMQTFIFREMRPPARPRKP